jgi:tetratricopeptide (TPR) repeat protein
MTQGLSLYFIHAYEEAYLMFSEANNENYWQANKGREVVYLFQGNAAGKASMFDNAKEAYLRSLDIEPDYARAHAGLGSVYYLQSLDGVTSDNFQPEKTELNKAIKSYEEALLAEIQPPSADIPTKVAFGLAQVYLTQWFSGADTLNSAVSQFEFVVKQYNDGKNPRVQELAAESYGRFGLIARHDDHYDDAIIQFTKAIEISTIPNRRGLYWATLADLYEDRKETNKAYEANKNSIDEYTAALSLTTQENIKAKYLDNIATRYEHMGDITSAIDALNRAINLSPEGSEERLIYEDRLNKLR